MVQCIVLCAAVALLWSTTTSSSSSRYCDGQRILQQQQQQLPSMVDIIGTDPGLTTLAEAFQVAAFDESFWCITDCNSTFFAPTNDAFQIFHANDWTMLLSPPWILHLRNLLALHVTVPNPNGLRRWSTELVDGETYRMLNDEIITIHDMKRGISISNPLTENSNLIQVDVIASNGVLHQMDTVLVPLFVGIDVFALGDPWTDFQILTTMLESVGLVGIRSEFTLLAPTDAAFKALGTNVLEELQSDTVTLRKLLVNHVIFGVHPSLYLTDGLVLTSLGGRNITFTTTTAATTGSSSDNITTTSDSIVTVTLPDRTTDFRTASNIFFQANGVNVMLTDILANNGVAHVIDQVLFDLNSFTNAPMNTPTGPSKSATPPKVFP